MPPRGREGILDPGVASRFDACAGVRPAPGRAGRCAPPHRAGREPGPPLGPHAPRLPPPPGADRRWVVDFTRVPTRHRAPAAPPSSRGLFSRRIVGWDTNARTGRRPAATGARISPQGYQRAHGAPSAIFALIPAMVGLPARARGTNFVLGAPRAGDPGAQGPRGRRPREPGPPQRPRQSVPVHRPAPDDSSTRAPRHPPEPWDPPTRAPPPGPRASPCKRGARSGATAPGEGPRRPPGPPPPDR